MDQVKTYDSDDDVRDGGSRSPESAIEAPPAIGTDERRMHVRAYNHWVSLLGGRAYPSIAELNPVANSDFGPHSVLLDFSNDSADPEITWLGDKLRHECVLDQEITHISDVPSRSLLSRLTDHYLQIIANRAPIGFEAEFVSQRGYNTLYRGILMPFSSDGTTIDFIYGVINWKELADIETTAALVAEVDAALREPPSTTLAGPLWADGPNAGAGSLDFDDEEQAYAMLQDFEEPLDDDAALADHLARAREIAEAARSSQARSRSSLYRALGLAYDFALVAEARPEDYGELLEDAGLKAQKRAPMTPIVKLVFGADYDKTRLTEFAAALSHGRRLALRAGQLRDHLESQPGGLKAIVKAERQARAPVPRRDLAERALDALRRIEPRAHVAIANGGEEFVLLVARQAPDGTLAILAPVPEDQALIERAVRRVAR